MLQQRLRIPAKILSPCCSHFLHWFYLIIVHIAIKLYTATSPPSLSCVPKEEFWSLRSLESVKHTLFKNIILFNLQWLVYYNNTSNIPGSIWAYISPDFWPRINTTTHQIKYFFQFWFHIRWNYNNTNSNIIYIASFKNKVTKCFTIETNNTGK